MNVEQCSPPREAGDVQQLINRPAKNREDGHHHRIETRAGEVAKLICARRLVPESQRSVSPQTLVLCLEEASLADVVVTDVDAADLARSAQCKFERVSAGAAPELEKAQIAQIAQLIGKGIDDPIGAAGEIVVICGEPRRSSPSGDELVNTVCSSR